MDRMCGDSSLLLEILDLFLEEFSSERQHLLNQIQSGDFAELARKAHYFKGIAQNLGLMKFLPQVTLLEQAAKQGDAACCTEAVESLSRVTQHLLNLRKNMTNA